MKIASIGTFHKNIFFQVYDDSSSAPKENILLLHGFPGWMVKNTDLAELLAANGYRVFLPHHEGLGLSNGKFSFKKCHSSSQDLINTIIKDYGPIKYVIGHSWGGFLALILDFPDIEKLLLLAPLSRIPASGYGSLDDFCAKVYSMEIKVFEQSIEHKTLVEDFLYLKSKHSSNLVKYKNRNLPISILHGRQDQVLSYKDSEWLSNQCGKNSNVQILETDHWLSDIRPNLYKEVLKWLNI